VISSAGHPVVVSVTDESMSACATSIAMVITGRTQVLMFIVYVFEGHSSKQSSLKMNPQSARSIHVPPTREWVICSSVYSGCYAYASDVCKVVGFIVIGEALA